MLSINISLLYVIRQSKMAILSKSFFNNFGLKIRIAAHVRARFTAVCNCATPVGKPSTMVLKIHRNEPVHDYRYIYNFRTYILLS